MRHIPTDVQKKVYQEWYTIRCEDRRKEEFIARLAKESPEVEQLCTQLKSEQNTVKRLREELEIRDKCENEQKKRAIIKAVEVS